MDRKTLLIIVGALVLIGGWMLANFVLWPEPSARFELHIDGRPINQNNDDYVKGPDGKATGVFKSEYANSQIALVIKEVTAVDTISVKISSKEEPINVQIADGVKEIVLTESIMDDLSLLRDLGRKADSLKVEITLIGSGGKKTLQAIELSAAKPPVVETTTQPTTGPTAQPPRDVSGTPSSDNTTLPEGISFTAPPRSDHDESVPLVLGTDEDTTLGPDDKLLYPIKVEFSRYGAAIDKVKLAGYMDRVKPTIWVGSGTAPPPAAYPLINPVKPLEIESLYSSSLVGIHLLVDKSVTTLGGGKREKYETVKIADVLKDFKDVPWSVASDGVISKNGVPHKIVFKADVVAKRTEMDGDTSQTVEMRLLTLTKTYWIEPGSYEVFCHVEVENVLPPAEAEAFGLPKDKLILQVVHTGGIGVPGGDLRYKRELAIGVQGDGKIEKEKFEDDTISVDNVSDREATAVQAMCLPCGGGATKGKPFNDAVEKSLLGGLPSAGDTTYKELDVSLSGKQVRWAGVYNKYFAQVWIPRNLPAKRAGKTVEDLLGWPVKPVPAGAKPWVKAVAAYGVRENPRSVTANYGIRFTTRAFPMSYAAAAGRGGRCEFAFSILAFPKRDDIFEKHAGLNLEAVKAPQGGCFCAVPGLDQFFGFILKGLSVVTFGNYGFAIILLVVVIRLLMFPLSRKGQLSMMKMQKLAPKIEELKKRYKDKQEMQRATMAMYREHGVSPFGGCLPMFIQMPIWVALWMALGSTIELRHAAFLPIWITDLAGPDALISWANPVNIPLLSDVFWGGQAISSFNLLPLLMAGVMFLQQKWAPKPEAETEQQAQQRKMMKYMMLIFPVLLYTAPAGLTLYIMTSTAIGLAETRYIRQHLKDLEERGELFKAKTGKGMMQRMIDRAQSLHDVGGPAGKGKGKSGGGKDWRSGSRGGKKQ